MGFDKLSTYGIMNEYSKDTIKDLIYFLITEGYIQCIGDKYPILVLNNSANDILFKNKQVFIKRKIEKISKPEKTSSTIQSDINYDASLFEILRALRKEIAEKNFIAPFIVFTDVSLKQMSSIYPTTKEEMLKINGVGINKFENYGEYFINKIKNYITENNIDVSLKKVAPESTKSENNKPEKIKIDTRIVSCNMYNENNSIDEIAKTRGLNRQNIEHHLLHCFENEININLEKDIQIQYKEEIYKAIDEIGFERLRPLKDILPSSVSYLDIRYFIITYKRENNLNYGGGEENRTPVQ